MTTFAEYRSIPAVNWSSLKHLRESPLKYKYALTAKDDDTTARALGRLVHMLVFEPNEVEKRYAVIPDSAPKRPSVTQRNAKKPSEETVAAIGWWDDFNSQSSGMEQMAAEAMSEAASIANAVRTHELVAPYLVVGEFEKTLTWTDEATGQPCKCRVDWLAKPALLDLKTTTTIDEFRFGRISARLGYHCQLAHYRNGVIGALGWEPDEVLLIAVESKAPYDVAVFYVDEDALWAGGEEVAGLMQRLAACQQADQWPGRYIEPRPLLLPAYVFGDGEDEEDPAGLGVTFGLAG